MAGGQQPPLPPTTTVPVAILTPSAPLSPITFYRDGVNAAPTELWVNQGDKPFALTAGIELSISTGTPATTFNLWWGNDANSAIGVWSNTAPTQTLGVSTFFKVNIPGLTSTAPGTTTASDATAVTQTSPPASLATGSSTNSVAFQTSTSPAPSHTSSSGAASKGLSSGAVAGVAIGCLIAGALIAGLLAWFCLGRRRKSVSARDSEASTLALMHKEKGPTAKAISLESGSPIAAAMENGLPQPLEDKAISGEISKISNLIKNHVQSYYHTRGVSPGMIDYDDIQALGSDLPVSTGTLSTLLGNSATREIALRFCIAWVVVSRMQLNGHPGMTFLPPEISKCFQEMSLVDRDSRAHAMFFAKWRVITAELMQSSYVRNPFSPSDARFHSIQDAASVLDNILRPYSDSRVDNGQRSRNLEEILKRAALFAFTLFSQPSSWGYDWQREQGVKSGSICIFPSLVQVADENGEPIKPARPFSEAVVRRLDE